MSHPALAEAQDPVAILAALDAVVYDWDIGSDRVVWGANAARTLRDLPPDALADGASYAALVTADSDASRYQAVFNGLGQDEGDGAPYRVRYRLAAGAGSLEIEDFGRWFADAEGRPSRAHGLVRVLARSRAPAAARIERGDDEQTLCTRGVFNAWVDGRCAEPRAPDAQLGMLMIGIGNLAAVNASHGYDVGDQLIAAVGRKLARSLRGGDKLVRYCGGKFAVLVALAAKDQPATAAARLAKRANADPYATSAGPLRAGARVGVALCPRHGRTAHLLLQRADEAYADTSSEGELVSVYGTDEARAETRRREGWVADEIVAALNERRIFLAFQPIAATGPDGLSFEEALVRMRLDDGGVVGPEAMIPVAEKLGLIELLDQRVMELVTMRLAEEPGCRLSMNVSMASLRAPDWSERLRARLVAAPGAAQRLTVEIVETQAIGDAVEVARILARVKALGVRVAMDDFGAGHTSFRNLRGLGVDMVKIDGAFVAGLAASVDDRFFVRTLASLAKHLGIVTVAEWVEDAESARLLKEWGVDYLQGHYIGRAEAPSQGRARATA